MRHLEPWIRAARELGLCPGVRSTVLVGTIRERRLQLELLPGDGVVWRLDVEPVGGLTIASETGLTLASQLLFGADLQLGEPAADRALHLRARDPERTGAALRRAGVGSLVSEVLEHGGAPTLSGGTLWVRCERIEHPDELRVWLRRLLPLAEALEARDAAPGGDALALIATRYGLQSHPTRLSGRVGEAWIRVERRAPGARVLVQTTIPALLDATIKRRSEGEQEPRTGDLILDQTVTIRSLDIPRTVAELSAEPVRSCVLELVHGHGAVLDGGRLDVELPDDSEAVLAAFETMLRLRTAASAPER